MTFSEKVPLGRTVLMVGRLGISSSFGAPAAAFEEAFERGLQLFHLGHFHPGAIRCHGTGPPQPGGFR